MPFCRECGTGHNDTARFCPSCGRTVQPIAEPLRHRVVDPPSTPKVRGWLLLLAVSLTLFTPLTLLFTSIGMANIEPILAVSTFVFSALMFIAGVRLWFRRPGADRLAKHMIVFHGILNALNTFVAGSEGHLTDEQVTGQLLTLAMWSVVWVLYLENSKRVRATFSPTPSEPREARSW